jgi:uncharacterized membrane protein HdeD (DUF308 family)
MRLEIPPNVVLAALGMLTLMFGICAFTGYLTPFYTVTPVVIIAAVCTGVPGPSEKKFPETP